VLGSRVWTLLDFGSITGMVRSSVDRVGGGVEVVLRSRVWIRIDVVLGSRV
jgi:hypothetical protein